MKQGFIYSLIVAGIMYLSITGADCEALLGAGGVNDTALAGTSWQLDRVTGALQDVCPGETVNFGSGGSADLTCPGSSTVSRNYTVNNSVLTYTQSGVTYNIDSLNNSRLVLRGTNVSRNLYYDRIVTTTNPPVIHEKSAGKNSSDSHE